MEETILAYTNIGMVMDNIKSAERIIFARDPNQVDTKVNTDRTGEGRYEITTDPVIFMSQNPGGPPVLVYKYGTSEQATANDPVQIKNLLQKIFNERYLGFGPIEELHDSTVTGITAKAQAIKDTLSERI